MLPNPKRYVTGRHRKLTHLDPSTLLMPLPLDWC
jgi:hypothetical protein